MAAICQFHQHGHCKFADKCDKIHTSATCDSFPCQDRGCPKRHPRMCKYYAMYGRCVYAERCSFLHFPFSGGEQIASQEVHAIEQEVYELREEVKHLREEVKHMLSLIKDLKEEIDVERVRKQGNDNLRLEIDRLKKGTDGRLCDAFENQKRLLEMIRDLRDELDMVKAPRGSAGTAWPKVEEEEVVKENIEEGNEGDFVTCRGFFSCRDTACLKHYTAEGNIRRGQADRDKEDESHRKNRIKGDKTGRQQVKSAALNGRTPGNGRGQN